MHTYDELWCNYKKASTPLEKCKALNELKEYMVGEAQRRTLEDLYNTNSATV